MANTREKEHLTCDVDCGRIYEVDEVIDASLYAIYKFHLFEADDERVISTMKQVEEKLWVKTRVGGLARYENDYYHRVSNDIASVPGNPWFICTLWLLTTSSPARRRRAN
jgi:GH15 family glucan-1,4-alpha-glucosidase